MNILLKENLFQVAFYPEIFLSEGESGSLGIFENLQSLLNLWLVANEI